MSCQFTRLIVTSRTENFKYSSSTIRQFQIVPLKDSQIKEFACKYLDENKGLEFFKQLERSPFKDTSIRPLILVFLLTIFEHNEKLPSRPTNLHAEIIDLLLAKWDKYRSIKRLSQFVDFEFQAKHDFLMDLSYELSKIGKSKFTSFELNNVYQIIKDSFPSLPSNSIDSILEEIEVHSGIFVKSGRMQYEFPHRSIQEYLAGEYIKNYVPITDLMDEIVKLPYESAIATTISKNPSNFFEIYTKKLLNLKGKVEFQNNIDIYLNSLGTLNPIFKTSWRFAYQIILLYNELFDKKEILETPLAKVIFSEGARRSFIELEKIYKIDDPITYVLIKREGKNRNRKITLRIRKKIANYNEKINSPAILLKDWKFLKNLLS